MQLEEIIHLVTIRNYIFVFISIVSMNLVMTIFIQVVYYLWR